MTTSARPEVPRRQASSDRHRTPEVLLDTASLRATVRRLADELGTRHDDNTVIVGVLKGAVIFISDLVRALGFHPRIDFVAISPFVDGEQVHMVKDLALDVAGADVVVVQDIVDTGFSLQYLLGELQRREPRSLSVCVLVDKPSRRLVPVQLDHVGIVVDDDFVIGFGLDFAGRYRNLRLLAAGDLDELRADPDCYRGWAYGNGIDVGDDIATSG